jgi:HK97 gp10 family phage protein
MLEINIQGLADLNKLLQELPAKIEANVLRGGLRAGAKVIEAEAKRQVPVGQARVTRNKSGAVTLHKPGALRDSIRISMRSRLKAGWLNINIKAGNGEAWYAHLVEFGTARHWIKPKNRKSLFFAGLAKELVDHPGAKPKPFMRPAFDAAHRAALDAMADYIRTRLPKEFNKAAKK